MVPSPGCVNAAGKARQKRKARAVTNFTKPGDRLLAKPCNKDAAIKYAHAKVRERVGPKVDRREGKKNVLGPKLLHPMGCV